MNTLNLSDAEFRHYHELYNMDPVVQRLCKIDYTESEELSIEIEELKESVESLEYENDYLRDELAEYKRENRILKEKIQVWKTLDE